MRWMVIALVIGLAGACGAPPAVRPLVQSQQVTNIETLSDAQVRAHLRRQVPAWNQLAGLLAQRQFWGVPVSDEFRSTVDAARAVARRQVELMDQGQDDPVKNRALLENFARVWRQVEKCVE